MVAEGAGYIISGEWWVALFPGAVLMLAFGAGTLPNMLGIGLHSYGFMDAAFRWLMWFNVSQVVLIVLCLLPLLTAMAFCFFFCPSKVLTKF